MTKKLKADVFAELLEETGYSRMVELMKESYKSKLIIAVCNIEDYLLLFIFSDLSIMGLNKDSPDEVFTFPLSRLNKEKSNLSPDLIKLADDIIDVALKAKAKHTPSD